MKKILCFALALLLTTSLCGCGMEENETSIDTNGEVESSAYEYNEELIGTFIEVDRGVSWKIVYHRDTKVMYVVKGAFTMLVNSDGTPMIYSE